MVLCLPSQRFDYLLEIRACTCMTTTTISSSKTFTFARHQDVKNSDHTKDKTNWKESERDLLIHSLSEIHTNLRFQRNQKQANFPFQDPSSWSSFATAGFHRAKIHHHHDHHEYQQFAG